MPHLLPLQRQTPQTPLAVSPPGYGGATAGSGRPLPPPSPPPPAPAPSLFEADHGEWVRFRGAFIHRLVPDAAAWPGLVCACTRTVEHIPKALMPAWLLQAVYALMWTYREPGNASAWLWLLLLPSLLLHVPARGKRRAAGAPRPLSLAARAASVLGGILDLALPYRDAGIWKNPPGAGTERAARSANGHRRTPEPRAADSRDSYISPAPAKRRALRKVRTGRLRSIMRALADAPAAAATPATCDKARTLFPAHTPGLGNAASFTENFPDGLGAAEDFGAGPGGGLTLPARTVTAAIRAAPRGTAPGPSGLRMEHLWALCLRGQDALVAVVLVLASPAAVDAVPAVTTHALAGANMLLLVKPGAPHAWGIPPLRPIGMPETLRKFVTTSLARVTRGSAAAFSGTTQKGIAVPNGCARVLHQIDAHLARNHSHGVLQLDFVSAFNLISRDLALAVVERAFPLLVPNFPWMYGQQAPAVYGWQPEPDDPLETDPWELLFLLADRGAQQGDPLGPLLHGAALHLVLWRLQGENGGHLVLAFHDDVIVVGPVDGLRAVMDSAAALGALVHARLSPAKRQTWSPAPAPPPAGLSPQWRERGIILFSEPLGDDYLVAARVAEMMDKHGTAVGLITALPAAELLSQLLLLRLCAVPKAIYFFRCLPRSAGRDLAAAVDSHSSTALLATL